MTRREREKKEEQKRRCQEWKENLSYPSDYIIPFDIKPGDRVFTASRVSTTRQERNGDLREQEEGLKYQIESAGGVVAGSYQQVGSGQDTTWLKEMFDNARKAKAKAVLIESVDRLVRAAGYSKETQHVVANKEELERALEHANGMSVMSVVDPDATYREVRAYQSKRGRKAKNEKAATRTQHRKAYLPRVLELNRKGMNSRKIARIVSHESGTSTSHTTVCNWLKQHTGSP